MTVVMDHRKEKTMKPKINYIAGQNCCFPATITWVTSAKRRDPRE